MPASILSQNYLRRRDPRRRVMLGAIVNCRGVTQKVRVVDFSVSGVRLDGIKGLAAGDPIQISLSPELTIDGQVVWSVWHKAGVKFVPALSEEHPAFVFLAEQASAIDRTRTLALASLAKDHARD
ncbi:MAG: PilZ domain-containing protein [Hyphomicrobium sp.]|uniref:PilZ domain-containing protein n=1 Tax=Hyphomicrobium sp. TaxID=82 RepID=UPI0039E6B9FB